MLTKKLLMMSWVEGWRGHAGAQTALEYDWKGRLFPFVTSRKADIYLNIYLEPRGTFFSFN